MKLLTWLPTLLLLASTTTFAHTNLVSSTPSDQAMLDKAPTEISLKFGANLKLIGLTVIDSKGKKVALDFKPSNTMQASFKQKLPVLAPEMYTVNWVAMGQDSHKMSGKFGFMVHNSNGTMP